MILIVDFGSQTAHLIKRRIEELGAKVKLVSPSDVLEEINRHKTKGIIFSGSPGSVYEKKDPKVDPSIFNLGIPILGICYGLQLIALLLEGRVKPGKVREYGPATLILNKKSRLFQGISQHSRVWMSHGDEVVRAPEGFIITAQSDTISIASMEDGKRKIYGIQFHPEVEHTEHGFLILKNFVGKICGEKVSKKQIDTAKIVKDIKKLAGKKKAIAAVSGGLDSTLAAFLTAKAIGENLIPIHIDNGLMRKGTAREVEKFFKEKIGLEPIIVRCEDEFLDALAGIVDPEEKRKIIGKLYIDLFLKEVRKIKEVKFLVQGTIYSDVIESKGSKHADNIKSHHNVGGLPEDLELELIEPLRTFYTDQVKMLARQVSLPEKIIDQQPHPGPGYAIRIIGEVTKDRLKMIQQADEIVLQEMKKEGYYKKLLHSFAILTGTKSTAVKGDSRVFGEVMALRAVTSQDRMTAQWARLPSKILQKIASRIVNEMPTVSRVVYDISTKPPATIEWE